MVCKGVLETLQPAVQSYSAPPACLPEAPDIWSIADMRCVQAVGDSIVDSVLRANASICAEEEKFNKAVNSF